MLLVNLFILHCVEGPYLSGVTKALPAGSLEMREYSRYLYETSSQTAQPPAPADTGTLNKTVVQLKNYLLKC